MNAALVVATALDCHGTGVDGRSHETNQHGYLLDPARRSERVVYETAR